jgi:hypothetical protein
MTTLVLGATPDDWRRVDISKNENIYFLDVRESSGVRFVQCDLTSSESINDAIVKLDNKKFKTIVFDVGVWHHLFRDGKSPDINGIVRLLQDGGELYLPMTPVTSGVPLSKDSSVLVIKNDDVKTRERYEDVARRFRDLGLTVQIDVPVDKDPVNDDVTSSDALVKSFVANRLEKNKFVVGTKSANKGGKKSRNKRRNKRTRKKKRKL